jgi:hypothetical protein
VRYPSRLDQMTPRSDDAKRDEDGPSNDSGCGDVSAAVLAH